MSEADERMLRVAMVQMCAGEDVAQNIAWLAEQVDMAAGQGAQLIVTPENSHAMVSGTEARQQAALQNETDQRLDPIRNLAKGHNLHILLGSVTIATADGLANMSLLIGPTGEVLAEYTKIHLFDVDLPNGETYRESDSMIAGKAARVAELPELATKLGLTICYDLRFAGLYRSLAKAGAEIITIPAAFTVPTGEAHWEVLLRARAIETGAFILAPAQTGKHDCGRATWGHSLVISPWGEVLSDAGEEPGVTVLDLKLHKVAKARAAIPQLQHARDFLPP